MSYDEQTRNTGATQYEPWFIISGSSDKSVAVMKACVGTWHELCDRGFIGCNMNVGSLSGPSSDLHLTLRVIGIALLLMSVT